MIKTPLVSIIIPAYNAEKTIGETLKSALNQSYKHTEIIVVNDGSTDQTAAFVQAVKDPKIILYNRQNTGQSAASNYGISKARGEYIKFLDADDLLSPYHIEQQVKKAASDPNALISCRWSYFTSIPETFSSAPSVLYKNYNDPLQWFLQSMHHEQGMMPAWLWLIPAPLLHRSGGWNNRLSLNNDLEFSTRLLMHASSVFFAEGAVYYYRQGVHNSMSANISRKAALSAYLTTLLTLREIRKREDSPYINQLFADRFQGWIYYFYPRHISIVNRMEAQVAELGGSIRKPEGGKLFALLRCFIPWKIIRSVQYEMKRKREESCEL